MTFEIGTELAGDATTLSLLAAAAGVGVLHTLAGPDHYLPFIAMAKAGRWSGKKTLLVTLLCGAGHVLGSLLLAGLGALLFTSFERAAGHVDGFADGRAAAATWLLIVTGSLYAMWGMKRALRAESPGHSHLHAHADGTLHDHGHGHEGAHLHPHGGGEKTAVGSALSLAASAAGATVAAIVAEPAAAAPPPVRRLTPWILFTIFVFGPCEPLLPLVLAPQVAGATHVAVLVVALFTLATLATMCAAVFLALRSTELLPARWRAPLAKYQHALAGGCIAACGVAMKFGL